VWHKNDIRAWGIKSECWPAVLDRLSSILITIFAAIEYIIANLTLLKINIIKKCLWISVALKYIGILLKSILYLIFRYFMYLQKLIMHGELKTINWKIIVKCFRF